MWTIKRIVVMLWAGICLCAASGQTSSSFGEGRGEALRLSLDECLAYAIGNNFTRQQMLLTEQSQEAGYKQSKRERLPDVSASLSEGVGHTSVKSGFWQSSCASLSAAGWRACAVGVPLRSTSQK